MSRSPFDPTFDQLPGNIPIFPLTGVLLLPGGRLPLNIFEPRYLAMTQAALAAPQRLIGMIQPQDPEGGGKIPPIYRTGCAGRITAFSETEDGRYLMTLTGVCRFHVRDDAVVDGGFRRAAVDFGAFRGDLDSEAATTADAIDRERLDAALRAYFKAQGMTANWDVIADTPSDKLITSLAMICPFEPQEKQALLECDTQADRGEMMVALMEMALHARETGADVPN